MCPSLNIFQFTCLTHNGHLIINICQGLELPDHFTSGALIKQPSLNQTQQQVRNEYLTAILIR